MIQLKSDKDIAVMRAAGKILASILEKIRHQVKPGVTTLFLDTYASRLMREAGVSAAFLGYRGYPASICTSVNEQIVHGIPGERMLKEGDIVSIDAGIEHNGFYADAAVTVPVGRIGHQARKLIDVTKGALAEGIRAMKDGGRLSDISSAVQKFVEKNGCSVVRQFVGHGIGAVMHEEPEIPNFGRPGTGPVLKKGMVLAIEPMVNAGGWECQILEDGWTAVTIDGKISAHFEHTVALTDKGAEILTKV
jgi:methionyl aminopeptidase